MLVYLGILVYCPRVSLVIGVNALDVEVYEFRGSGLALTGYDIHELYRMCKKGVYSSFEYSLNEASIVFRVTCNSMGIVIRTRRGDEYSIGYNDAEKAWEKPEQAYIVTREGVLKPLILYTRSGVIRLRGVKTRYSTTVEINGIHMHRIVGVTPFTDSLLKILRLGVKPGFTVLDTCMGLGYTAINAAMRGARRVYTVEINEAILWLAQRNPWSWPLEQNRNITIILGDTRKVIEYFRDETFHVIIHDPPSILIAGDLYSASLYQEFYRVLRKRGRLLHYVGETGRHRGRGSSVVKGVIRRLREVGFYPIRYDRETRSVIADKP